MKVRVTTAKGTYWVEEDEVDTIDDDTSADDEVPSGDEQDVEAHDADDEGGMFAWLGDKFQVTPHMAEWLVGILVAVVAVAVTAYMARDMWFTSDEWEYLANRTAFDLGDLTRPVGGHWTTWSVLLLRGLYKSFGVDFWPWFYIPRLIGHTVLVTFIWRVMRRRGADPLVGLFAYAVLLVLGASGYQRALQVGNWAVYAALIICALVINRRPAKPTTRDQVIVAGALMIAVFGNGYAVAVIGGIIGTLLLARRLVAWIPSLIPAVVAYGIWYLNYRDDIKPKPELTPSKILDIPSGAFRVVRTAMEAATGFPAWLAAVAVMACWPGSCCWPSAAGSTSSTPSSSARWPSACACSSSNASPSTTRRPPVCATATRSASSWPSPWSPTSACPRPCSCGRCSCSPGSR